MPLLRAFHHIGLVDLDAETGTLRNGNEAVFVSEDLFVGDVVEDVVRLVVVDAEALFLDEGVIADRVDLQAGGKGNRPEGQCGASATS